MIYDLRFKNLGNLFINHKSKFINRYSGFTLIELLVVMGLFAVLSAFVTINLIRPQTKASVDATVNTLNADLRGQQVKSMVGASENQATSLNYGIYFNSGSYVLFRGVSYNPSDTSNFTVSIDAPTTISTTFPNSQVVFSKKSGEVNNFVNGLNIITISDDGGEQKIITINQLGVPNIQ